MQTLTVLMTRDEMKLLSAVILFCVASGEYVATLTEHKNIYKKSHPGLQADFVATRDVGFYLYTTNNPTVGRKITNSTSSVSSSNFNAANPTRFIVHGWMKNYTSEFNQELTAAYLSRGNFNVKSYRVAPSKKFWIWSIIYIHKRSLSIGDTEP